MVSIIDLRILVGGQLPTRSSGQLGIQIHVGFKCFFLAKIGTQLNSCNPNGQFNPSNLGSFDTNYFINFLKRLKFSQNYYSSSNYKQICEGKLLNFQEYSHLLKQKNSKLIN